MRVKPCPFCGGEIEPDVYSGNEYVCKNCDLWGLNLDWWNTRPIEDKLKAENKLLAQTIAEKDVEITELKEEIEKLQRFVSVKNIITKKVQAELGTNLDRNIGYLQRKGNKNEN